MKQKDKQSIVLGYLAAAVAVLGIACVALRQRPLDALPRFSMLDVGQGDSILIQAANGAQLLIDAGPDEKVLSELAKVMPPGDRSIDVVIATHPDADHIVGLPMVLSRYDVGLFLTTQAGTDSQIYRTLFQTINDRDIPAYYARHGMTITLDQGEGQVNGAVRPPVTFSVLFPDRDTTGWETNTASVIGRLQIGQRSALFTGDAPSSVEEFLAGTISKNLDADILKLGHHGSKTSSSDIFLRVTSPTLALVSAGIDNRYGHPAPEVLARLKAFGIPPVSTQDVGTYTMESDGEAWYAR
jgi:competence protein ComEC